MVISKGIKEDGEPSTPHVYSNNEKKKTKKSTLESGDDIDGV
jgi:hypothetical protein